MINAAPGYLVSGLSTRNPKLPVIDCYGDPLKQAIESGRVAVALVDRSVARVD